MAIFVPRTVSQLRRRHGQQILALEQGLPADLGAAGQPHDRLGGDALARSRLADDAERLPGVHGERHPPDRLHDPVRRRERHVKVVDLE